MRILFAAALAAIVTPMSLASDFREVSFQTADSATIHANLYGQGDHAVVLAHGMVFDKESWDAQAVALAGAGLQVLAIDFRGYGKSSGPGGRGDLYQDVLGAVTYLRGAGAKRVSLVGGSMGGGAVGRAAVEAEPGTIHRVILLAASPVSAPEKMQGDKLFVVSRGDAGFDSVKQQHQRAGGPKKLVVLDGSAHAQHILGTDRGPELLKVIRDWLTK